MGLFHFILTNLIPNPNGLIVVFSNSCRQKFTFEITGGSVTYLGPDDYHEPEYDVCYGGCGVCFYWGTPISGLLPLRSHNIPISLDAPRI
jgi:hypothetical protein